MQGEEERGRRRSETEPRRVLGGRGRTGARQNSQGDRVKDRGVEAVKHDVRQVIAARVHTPEPVVEGVAQPAQRRIVAEPERGEHPGHVAPGEAPVGQVVDQELVVVPIDEMVVQCREERGARDKEDRGRPEPGRAAGRGGRRSERGRAAAVLARGAHARTCRTDRRRG